jgi:hypothetical protein
LDSNDIRYQSKNGSYGVSAQMDGATIPQPCGRIHPFFKDNTLFFKLKYMI